MSFGILLFNLAQTIEIAVPVLCHFFGYRNRGAQVLSLCAEETTYATAFGGKSQHINFIKLNLNEQSINNNTAIQKTVTGYITANSNIVLELG